MKMFVPNTADSLGSANAWFCAPALQAMLFDLERELVSLEADWGECFIFIEVDNRTDSHESTRQIDLLISFSDRAVIAELKGHRDPQEFLDQYEKFAGQVARQRDRLTSIIKVGGFDRDAVWPFILAWNLGEPAFRTAIREKFQFAHHYLTLSSSLREFAAISLEKIPSKPNMRREIRPAVYFPKAVREVLSALMPSHKTREPMSGYILAQFRLGRTARKLECFVNFDELRKYLLHAALDDDLRADRTHVFGLRPSQHMAATRILAATHFLEVRGQSGVGKTWFLREILARFDPIHSSKVAPLRPKIILNASTLSDVLRVLLTQVGSQEPEKVFEYDDTELLRLLLQMRVVYWIRDFDIESEKAIAELQKILSIRAQEGNAYWVLESVALGVGRSEISKNTIVLPPLDHAEIVQVLEASPGGSGVDISSVAAAAQGIPEIATLYWQRGDPEAVLKKLDRYEFFFHYLPSSHKAYVQPLAYIISEAPLGCTFKLAEEWCRSVRPFADGNIHEIVGNLLSLLHQQRHISLELIWSESTALPSLTNLTADNDDKLSAIRNALLPSNLDDASVALVQIVDPRFISQLFEDVPAQTILTWRESLEAFLLDAMCDDVGSTSLTSVTAGLVLGDLSLFIRSGFRTSSATLPRLRSWLDRLEQKGESWVKTLDALYFRHWLHWTIDHYFDDPAKSSKPRELAKPTGGDFQRHLYDLARTRGQFYRTADGYSWQDWISVANEFRTKGKLDLWAEACLRRSQALLKNPNGPEECWKLMMEVFDKREELSDTMGRGFLNYLLLSFLNKDYAVKQLSDVQHGVSKLVRERALDMAGSALRDENLSSIANAAFFLVRAVEKERPLKTAAGAAAVVDVMRFVQRTSPARRVQALLTEGSAHRHYCQSRTTTWAEFQKHFSLAEPAYASAIDAARQASMWSALANGIAYLGHLIGRSFEFRSERDFRTWLGKVAPRQYYRLDSAVDDPELVAVLERSSGENRRILAQMQVNFGLVSWAAGISSDPKSAKFVPQELNWSLTCFRSLARSSPIWLRLRGFNTLLAQLLALVELSMDDTNGCALVSAMSAPLIAIAEDGIRAARKLREDKQTLEIQRLAEGLRSRVNSLKAGELSKE